MDTLDNYNFGSIKDYKSYDNQNKRSKFQIFYGDEYFDPESPGKTQNTYENNNNNNNNQLMKFNTTDIESHYIWTIYSSQLSSSTWSNTKRYDTFIFNILIESNQQSFNPNDKIEFAICFIAFNNNHNNDKTEYWDNNNNENYIIEQRKLHPHLINIMNINNSQSSNQDDTQTNQLSIIDKSLNNNSNNNNNNCTIEYNIPSYTLDCRPNFDGFTSFTNYRAWNHFSGETSYY
ncbi:unnamed protein product [Schistosoma curassoni]|uniref:CBM21 domain-containing protein n=1 Tax=Schistosoma curassoni TaxID=6186 RepID=A0A3P8I8M9_9TREM|nr:unnamed protein product [Schistosoma curassoni]